MIVFAKSNSEDTPPARLGSWAWTKTALLYCQLAQLVEHVTVNHAVQGSSPWLAANGPIAQLGEHLPCKQEVASSTLAGSTTICRGSPTEEALVLGTSQCGFESLPRHHKIIKKR